MEGKKKIGGRRLHSKRRVARAVVDTVGESKRREGEQDRAWGVILEAQSYWQAMERFRRDRERNKNYTYGRQWDDIICVDGKRMREEDYIRSQGNIALKNNLIRRLVQAVLGVYRSQMKEPTCTARDRDEQRYGETMSTVLQCNMQRNRMGEVNSRCMEEFLISGMVVQRKWYGWREGELDCWTDYVQPNNFFIDNNMRDFRGWDATCVGEIHDISFSELCGRFAKGAMDVARLGEIYKEASDPRAVGRTYEDFGYTMEGRSPDFFVARDGSRCRVIEVWRKESKGRYRCHDLNSGDVYKIEEEDYAEMVEAENEERLRTGRVLGMPEEDIPLVEAEWFVDTYWYYYFLTPFGDILEEGETPYEHKGHPYVFKAYPFIDGEIHSFVSNVIDQQRYTNRLITMYDWIMRASAKGVLLFPEECIPDGMSMDDIADEWARFNGVIMIKSGNYGRLPTQVANNSTNIGIHELLNMQLKFFEDISGVNGALQGKPGFSGMSASLYAQQTQNSTTSLLDLLETFSSFVREGAYKDVKNIQQYYDTPRVFNIAGKNAVRVEYDPRKMRNVEFDLTIVESTATPAYRAMANEVLMQLWQSQAITVEQLLEHGDYPFADELLQSIKSERERMEAGQQRQGLPAELAAQAQGGADMEAARRAEEYLRG